MVPYRRVATGAAFVATVALLSCDALTGANDLRVCGLDTTCDAGAPDSTVADATGGETGSDATVPDAAGGGTSDAPSSSDSSDSGDSGDASDASDSAAGDAADASPLARLCTSDDWCWENPLPTGANVRLWSNATKDVWLSGSLGLAARFDGKTFTQAAPVPEDDSYYEGLWGVGSDVWFVGQTKGRVVRYSGGLWSDLTLSVPLRPIGHSQMHGASANDAWIYGENDDAGDYFLHWNGAGFDAPVTFAGTSGVGQVFVLSNNLAWAAAKGGVWSWNGATWSFQSLPGTFSAVWALGPNDVWLGGTATQHFTGTWSTVTGPSASVTAFYAPPGGHLYAADGSAIYVLNAGNWQLSQSFTPPASVTSITGPSDTELYASGLGGSIFGFDGSTWKPLSSGAQNLFAGCWVSRGGRAWAAGGGEILRRSDDGSWAGQSPPAQKYGGIAGWSETDLWAVGGFGAIAQRQPSGAWQSVTSPAGTTLLSTISAVWGLDAMWIVGAQGTILGRSGGAWVAEASGTTSFLRALYVAGANDVWAGGDSDTLLRRTTATGGTWSPVTLPTTGCAVQGIDGTSSFDMLLVGNGCAVMYDGFKFTSLTIDPTWNLNTVKFVGLGVGYVGGSVGGSIPLTLRWDRNGRTLTPEVGGGTLSTNGLCVGPTNHDVWAVSAQGNVLHKTLP